MYVWIHLLSTWKALWSTVGLNKNEYPKHKSNVECLLYLHFRDNWCFIHVIFKVLFGRRIVGEASKVLRVSGQDSTPFSLKKRISFAVHADLPGEKVVHYAQSGFKNECRMKKKTNTVKNFSVESDHLMFQLHCSHFCTCCSKHQVIKVTDWR